MTPEDKSSGLGSFPFARRYSGNRSFFLFLRVLRCFSSPGSLVYTMDSCKRDWSSTSRVSPFGYQGIYACLRLPLAFRSLPRPSSALGALASTLCSCSLDFSPETSLQSSGLLDFLLATGLSRLLFLVFLHVQLSRCAAGSPAFRVLFRILKTIQNQRTTVLSLTAAFAGCLSARFHAFSFTLPLSLPRNRPRFEEPSSVGSCSLERR